MLVADQGPSACLGKHVDRILSCSVDKLNNEITPRYMPYGSGYLMRLAGSLDLIHPARKLYYNRNGRCKNLSTCTISGSETIGWSVSHNSYPLDIATAVPVASLRLHNPQTLCAPLQFD